MKRTYPFFFDVPTRQESKVWVFEDDPPPTMVKRQQAMKKVMYVAFFRSTGLNDPRVCLVWLRVCHSHFGSIFGDLATIWMFREITGKVCYVMTNDESRFFEKAWEASRTENK
ncbi:hypothetical protein TNCV_917111 [Trichonephila clavipes]|nr:hypothetical protein TNCV_917111 [Trichonephila clavipes]